MAASTYSSSTRAHSCSPRTKPSRKTVSSLDGFVTRTSCGHDFSRVPETSDASVADIPPPLPMRSLKRETRETSMMSCLHRREEAIMKSQVVVFDKDTTTESGSSRRQRGRTTSTTTGSPRLPQRRLSRSPSPTGRQQRRRHDRGSYRNDEVCEYQLAR